MSIKDSGFLAALSGIIERANVESETVPLTEEQITMLALSDADIEDGRVIEQQTLHERELQWLKENSLDTNCRPAKKNYTPVLVG